MVLVTQGELAVVPVRDRVDPDEFRIPMEPGTQIQDLTDGNLYVIGPAGERIIKGKIGVNTVPIQPPGKPAKPAGVNRGGVLGVVSGTALLLGLSVAYLQRRRRILP